MYIVIICSIIALLLTFLESKAILRNGMKLGFLLVTFLICVHYNYGNDYMGYLEIYELVENNSLLDIIRGNVIVHGETGWQVICWCFQHLGGFFSMVAVLGIIQNLIVYQFIKKYVDPEWYTFAVFIYLFVSSFYLLSFSMMRQFLVMTLLLAIWPFIEEKKWWIALPCLFVCSQIHSSSIVFLPFAFFGYIPMKNGKLLAVSLLILFLILFLSKSYLNTVFMGIMHIGELSSYMDTYAEKKEVNYGLGFLINMIPFCLCLYYLIIDQNDKFHGIEMRRLVFMSSIAIIILPFVEVAPLVARVGYYFGFFQMAAYPVIYKTTKEKVEPIGLVSMSLFVLITLMTYLGFYNSDVYGRAYAEFHTIFEVL